MRLKRIIYWVQWQLAMMLRLGLGHVSEVCKAVSNRHGELSLLLGQVDGCLILLILYAASHHP